MFSFSHCVVFSNFPFSHCVVFLLHFFVFPLCPFFPLVIVVSCCPLSFGHCLLIMQSFIWPLCRVLVLFLLTIVVSFCPFSFPHSVVFLTIVCWPLCCLFAFIFHHVVAFSRLICSLGSLFCHFLLSHYVILLSFFHQSIVLFVLYFVAIKLYVYPLCCGDYVDCWAFLFWPLRYFRVPFFLCSLRCLFVLVLLAIVCPFVFFLLAIVLSVLQFTTSDYRFNILKFSSMNWYIKY